MSQNFQIDWVNRITSYNVCYTKLLRPAVGATVKGAWSGVISNGDTSRVTGTDGVATFYSARSKTSGEVTFCVVDITRVGSEYNPDADLEDCDSIVK